MSLLLRFPKTLPCSRCCLHSRRVVAFAAVRGTTAELLDAFWEARGVLDAVQRKLLVDAAGAITAESNQTLDSAPLSTEVPLPGLPAAWQLAESAPEVLAASRRLLALQQLLGGAAPRAGGDAGSGRVLAAASSHGAAWGAAAGGRSSSGSSGGGGGGVDVVWMVVREPGLLSADLAQLTARLLDMKLATFGWGVDVLRLVEAQPALLLSDRWRLDLESLQAPGTSGASSPARHDAASAPVSSKLHAMAADDAALGTWPGAGSAALASTEPAGGSGGGGDAAGAASVSLPAAAMHAGAADGGGSSAVQELVQAWQYGIASDGDREWAARLASLGAYRERHGDTGVGFREGDDSELARWAAKQRADWRKGRLVPERLQQLSSLGFEFDADEAEWVRWFGDLVAFKRDTGHASPMPLVTGADMYLINWCSVQRIARRSRVLSESRIQRLDELGFDWSGADPLS